jgi:sugar phosphate isomerase/epimerase
MNLKDRIGYDAGSTPLEEALQFAIAHQFHYLNFNADTGTNRLDNWSKDRAVAVQELCQQHDIRLSLHTASSVNVAETSPFVNDAVDIYLQENINVALLLDCESVVVHGGYHFSNALADRMEKSLERLKRLVGYAEGVGAMLLLENLNFEPDAAEIHYLAHNVEECRYYLDAIQSECLGWAFTVNHANLVPEGIDGFLDAFGVERIGEVRLADNLGDKEVHLNPGDGNIDFASMFRRLESSGFNKFYTMNFGSLEDMLKARDLFAAYVL